MVRELCPRLLSSLVACLATHVRGIILALLRASLLRQILSELGIYLRDHVKDDTLFLMHPSGFLPKLPPTYLGTYLPARSS